MHVPENVRSNVWSRPVPVGLFVASLCFLWITASLVWGHVAGTDQAVPIPKKFEKYCNLLDEECWTDGNNKDLDYRSKTLAEEPARDFVNKLTIDQKFELATINPGSVWGPVLNTNDSCSVAIVKRILEG